MIEKYGLKAEVITGEVLISITMPLPHAFFIRDLLSGLSENSAHEIIARASREGAIENFHRLSDTVYQIFDVFDDVTAEAPE